MSFWGELKRRNVYKVGVAYAIVAWLLIQAASIIFPHLNLPSWATTFVIVILIIGFPIALLLAWAYEVTPDGIKRTKQVPLAESITHLTGQKLNYIVTGLLVVAVAALVVDNYLLDKDALEPEVVSTEPEQAPAVSEVEEEPKTIAVLPFEDLSPEKDQEYFVLGLSEEILNSLTQIPDLTVIARTSSFSFKGTNKKIQEIASELEVAHILEGSVRKAGSALRITAQLVKGVDGSHLWSKTYDRELKDIFAVQEDIATTVADELKVTLGIVSSHRILGGTDSVEAYEHYLVAKGQMWTEDPTITNRALESLNTALEIDPDFALAWAAKAISHNSLIIFGPAHRVVAEQEATEVAAAKAIELEPNLAEGYMASGFIKMTKGQWTGAELAYRKALELTDELFTGKPTISVFYHSVGHFHKAQERLDDMWKKDPLNKNARGLRVLNFVYLGKMQRAEEEYERGHALFGANWFMGNYLMSLARLSPGDAVSRDKIVYSDSIFDMSKGYIASSEEGLEELRRIYTNGDNLSSTEFFEISIWSAYFGDHDFAMDAIEKAADIEAGGLYHIWLPVMHEVRQTPRFKEFVKKIGLVDYWNEFGWPDICRPLDNDDFECD